MQIKLFTVPVIGGQDKEKALNLFLRSHQILEVEKHLVQNSGQAYWCFGVSYLMSGANIQKVETKKARVDYKELLSEQVFQRFNQFRALRKAIAEKEGIPVYAVFTNHELVEMAKLEKDISTSRLSKIEGIGKKKIEKYAQYFINYEEG